MLNPFKKVLLALSVSAMAAPVVADTETPAVRLDDDGQLVITISRGERSENILPANVDVITAEQIEQSGAHTLEEVLRTVSGVQVSANNAGSLISVRGFSPEQVGNNVLVLVDGVRLNNISLEAPDLGMLPLESIERIEILKGSGSVLYGDQAVGGVINIITHTGRSPQKTVSVGGGSFNGKQISTLSVERNGKARAVTRFDFDQNDQYRDHSTRERMTGDIRFEYDVSPALNWYAQAGVSKKEIELPGASTASDLMYSRTKIRQEFSEDFIRSSQENSAAGLDYVLADGWHFLTDAQYMQRSSKSRVSFLGFPVTTDSKSDSRQKRLSPRLVGNTELAGKALDLVVGADLEMNEYSFEGAINVRDTQKMRSAYFNGKLEVLEGISLILGGRKSRVNDKLFDQTSYPGSVRFSNSASAVEGGVDFQLNLETRVYLRHGTNFRFAKADENNLTAPGVIGLDPQRGESSELGVEYRGTRISSNASVYQLKLKDEIFFDNTIPSIFGGANANGERSERQGVNWNLDARLTESFSAGFAFAFTDAKWDSGVNKHKEIPFVAARTLNLFARYQVIDSLSVYAEVLAQSETRPDFDIENTQEKQPGRGVANLAVQYDRGDWNARLRVNNIGDKQYNEYVTYDPYYAWSTPGEPLRFYPAAERNYWIDLEYRF